MTPKDWLAERTKCFDASGIRKVFDLGAKLKNPSTCRSGSPTSTCPRQVRQAAIDAITAARTATP